MSEIERGREVADSILTLSHHGVKGMKWGVRKSKDQIRRERGSKQSWSARRDSQAKAAVAERGFGGAAKRLAGRAIVKQVLTQAGGNILANTIGANDPSVRRGLYTIKNLVSTGIAISDADRLVRLENQAGRS